jgi:hypothetical protein
MQDNLPARATRTHGDPSQFLLLALVDSYKEKKT